MSVEIIKYGDTLKGSTDSVTLGNIELVMRVTAQAKTLCPVRKGQLRGSLMWKVPGFEGGHEEGNVIEQNPGKGDGLVGTATEYAAYVEFGTRYMDAQPYLRPAVTIEVFGPNGLNTMKEASIKAMTKALTTGRKTIEF